MPDRVFVDTNIWLYSLVQDPNVSDDTRHSLAFDILQALSRPVINSQVMRETCSNLIRKAGFSEGKCSTNPALTLDRKTRQAVRRVY